MSRVARAVFAVLVVATFGAFFVAQRLKNSPTVVQYLSRRPQLSPNGDGRFDTTAFSFRLKQTDDVTVDVVDAQGSAVRRLADDVRIPAYRQRRFTWDGRRADGSLVPDGRYRLRITLRREGRSIVATSSVTKDTVPPKVRVTGVGPAQEPAPEFLPTADGSPVRVRFTAPGRKVSVSVFRTDTPAVERVAGSGELPPGTTRWDWDGTVDGRRARAGTYVAVAESRDSAGNVGTSVPERRGVPVLAFGRRLPGRGGITVRDLAVRPPSAPTVAGERAEIFVDARGKPWRWSLRRVGGRRQESGSRTSATGARLRLRTPGRTGVYLLTVNTSTHRQRVPLVVQRSAPVGRVLVVLPWITWQGRNAVDDDGDGRANTLDAGVGVRADRVLAGDGLPAGFADHEAPLLAFLDRTQRDYDVTTDLALARGTGPKLDEFNGVLLPGDARWLTAGLGRALRRFAQRGGTVASLGTDSLRRQVTLTPRGRLVSPTVATPADLFGARLRPVASPGGTLDLLDDRIGLFKGAAGRFPGVGAYEATASVGPQAQQVAAAVTGDAKPVVVAVRFGKGLVVRTGIPDLAVTLGRPERAALINRIWVLLSRGAPA